MFVLEGVLVFEYGCVEFGIDYCVGWNCDGMVYVFGLCVFMYVYGVGGGVVL